LFAGWPGRNAPMGCVPQVTVSHLGILTSLWLATQYDPALPHFAARVRTHFHSSGTTNLHTSYLSVSFLCDIISP
jgi:hypothetical protein